MLIKLPTTLLAATLVSCGGAGGGGGAGHPTGERRVRQPVDPVGYTHTAEGIARVVDNATRLEVGPSEPGSRATVSAPELEQAVQGPPLLAAISPHDDYQYAQQVYVHVYPRIQAKDVILIGVAHKARDYPEVEGKLVFDSFDAWHGPYGDVPISPLRAELLAHLAPDDVVVHDQLQSVEHSVEALVPWLQHYDREVRIVSILVPYMSWPQLRELADHTSGALAEILTARKLELGRDVAVLISSDAVHYGDQDWGDKGYADFGVDQQGYQRAVDRDRSLIADYLVGEVSPAHLESFYHQLVEDDFHQYRITWCGRFSIPFGLALLRATTDRLGLPAPVGELLRYGTTLDPGRSDPGVAGLGVTAPANLHHWVGHAAIGYR